MAENRKYQIAYGKLLNRCWKDPSYLAKFRENPAAALEDFGIPTIPGARYHIVAPEEVKPSTEEDVYLYYMEKPKTRELSKEMLDAAAGGNVDVNDSAYAMAGFIYKNSNFVVNTNVAANTQAAADSLVAVETVSVAALYG